MTATLAASSKRHLLLTGVRGCGKSTLADALAGELGIVCGIRTAAVRTGAEPPSAVLLTPFPSGESVLIGQPVAGKMTPCPTGFLAGAAALRTLADAPEPWVLVDEVGFLETHQPEYRAALLALFERKRVLAVLRQGNHALPTLLRGREDALLFHCSEEML